MHGVGDDLLLGHAGRRQRVHDAEDGDGGRRVPARELHRVEEPVLVRDLRPRRQDRDRRPRRQLRRRATRALPDAAGDGPARDDHLRVSRRRPLVGARVRRVPRGHPPDREPAAGSAPPALRSQSSSKSIAQSDYRCRQPLHAPHSLDDHHAQPAPHHARRRRHRPAVVLPRARRVSDRRRRSTSTST